MKGKKLTSKNKKIIISISFIIAVGVISALGYKIKVNQNNTKSTAENVADKFEVTGENGLKFKGISVVSKEQRVVMDKTLGDIESVNVSNKQEVSEGDVLFTYSNPAVSEEVAGVERQIASANEKINRSNGKRTEFNNEIEEYKNQLNAVKSKKQGEATPELEAKEMELTQKLQAAQAKIEAEDAAIETLKDSSADLEKQKESLSSKQKKVIKAEINGVVYINEKGLTDPTVEYMRVVSKEPLVKAEVSEFDVETLKADSEVQIKVVSNGDIIKGKISSVDELPTVSTDGKTTAYNFYVKPEKAIRVGFSVEVKVKEDSIQIPKDYVYEQDSKLYVAKSKDDDKEDPFEKIEIKAELKGDNYSLIDGDITVGDKLMKNPSDIFKGDN